MNHLKSSLTCLLSLLRFIFLLSFFITPSLGHSKKATPKDTVVSEAIGRVKEQIVSSRDVKINYFIESALVSKQKVQKILSLERGGNKFSRQSTNLFLEWVLYFESELFPVVQASKIEKKRAIEIVKKAGLNSQFWKKLQVTPKELKAVIHRKILSKKFLYFKLQSSELPVLKKEVSDFYKKQSGNLQVKNLKELKKKLESVKKNKRLQDWLNTLRKKYNAEEFKIW